jgi:hypothetical protein
METIFASVMEREMKSVDIMETQQQLVKSVCDAGIYEMEKTHYVIEKRECSICLDDIRQNNMASAPCGHQFCFTCILRAFYEANACPYCRAELVDLPEEEEDSEYESQAEEDDASERSWETCSDSEEDDIPDSTEHDENEIQEPIEQPVKDFSNMISGYNSIKRVVENRLFAMEDRDAY